MSEQRLARLSGIGDTEFLWEPPIVRTVTGPADGRTLPTARVWAPTPSATPPRTIAWSVGHVGWGCFVRGDDLVGAHQMRDDGLDWLMTADEGLAFLAEGLTVWRAEPSHAPRGAYRPPSGRSLQRD
jgi:hypothetical protein